MHLDRAASRFLVQPLLDIGALSFRAAIPILMYHSISDDEERGVAPYYRLTTSPARFRDHMRWLSEEGYAVVSLAEALRRLGAAMNCSDRVVVLTFDDGFEDFRSQAWPVLAAHGFAASVFLPTAFIGDANRSSFNGRPCLTWREVAELSGRGVSFGAHTVTHPVLYRRPWTEVRRELRDSRQQIEDRLQVPVRTFAYPYAFPREDRAFVQRFRAELLESGYTAGVTTIVGRVSAETDRLCLKRLPMSDSDDRDLFVGKLNGAYDWVGGLQWIYRHLTHPVAAARLVWRTA